MGTITFKWLFHQSKLKLRPIHSPQEFFTTVQASELKDPTEFTKTGAVVFTLGLAFKNLPEDFSGYARTLASAGVHGIGIGTGLFFSTVPPELIQACIDYELTLFEVPRAIPFISIINAVNAELTRQDQERQHAFQRQQERLNHAATQGISKLITQAGKELRAAVALTNAQGVEITNAQYDGIDALQAAQSAVSSVSDLPPSARSLSSKNERNVSTIVTTFQNNCQHQYGLAVCATEKIGTFQRALIRHVVGLSTLLLQPAHSHIQHTLGQLTLAVQLQLAVPKQLETAFGMLSASNNINVYLVCTDSPAQLRRVLASLKSPTAQGGTHHFHLNVDDSAVLIVTPPTDTILQDKESFPRLPSTARVSFLPQLPWRELNSDLLVQMTTHAHSLDRGTSHRYSSPAPDWLYNPSVQEALKNRRRTTTDKLAEYDSTHNSDLLPTLKAFLLAGSQIASAAERLAVHRHTVRARIEKIQALCGIDLTNPVIRAELLLLTVSN